MSEMTLNNNNNNKSNNKEDFLFLRVSDKMGLEEIVRLANQIGIEYANAKKQLDYLELMKSTVRAKVMLRLDNGEMSEVKLKRLADIDPEYVQHLNQIIEARTKCEKLKIQYESYKNLFEARRSLLSYHKAELKLF